MSEGGINNGIVEPAVADCCVEADSFPPDMVCSAYMGPGLAREYSNGSAVLDIDH